MKKLISLLLAVSVMTMSSSAFALALTTDGTNRNPGANNSAAGKDNSNFIRDAANDPRILPVYRAGDTLTFSLASSDGATLGLAAGKTVTFISSKMSADLSNATVQFIDQVPATGTNFTATYKLRNDLEDGIYKIDVKFGDADVKTFYYTIGTPEVKIATIDEEGTQKAMVVGNKAYYFGNASIGTGKATFYQAGVQSFGFDFGGKQQTFNASVFDEAFAGNRVEGAVNWWFTIAVELDEGLENIPDVTGALVGDKNAN